MQICLVLASILPALKIDDINATALISLSNKFGIFCEFKKRAQKPYVVLISTTYPHPSPEDRSQVYKQFTDAGIPAVFGMENTANSLKKYVEYYKKLYLIIIIKARVIN